MFLRLVRYFQKRHYDSQLHPSRRSCSHHSRCQHILKYRNWAKDQHHPPSVICTMFVSRKQYGHRNVQDRPPKHPAHRCHFIPSRSSSHARLFPYAFVDTQSTPLSCLHLRSSPYLHVAAGSNRNRILRTRSGHIWKPRMWLWRAVICRNFLAVTSVMSRVIDEQTQL